MRAVLLLSGGFDSAVCAKLMIEAGHKIEALHFSMEPLSNNEPERRAREVCEKLGIKMHVINIAGYLKEMAPIAGKYYFVLMKRFMNMLAQQVCEREGFEAIATGENLAQVSSQTLPNIAVVDKACSVPVMRPVLCLDKQEIIDMAREMGLYETCCAREQCDVLAPPKHATVSRLEEIELLEKEARVEGFVQKLSNTF